MLIFLKKVIIFLLPVLLLFILPAAVIFFGREYVSSRDVVKIQTMYPDAIFSFAYNDISFIPYKKLLIEEKKPTIIALGTSRVMQIRKEFFKEPEMFVNAGGGAKTLEDMKLFLEELPTDSRVKTVILGLDQTMFHDVSESPEKRTEDVLPLRVANILTSMSRRMYLDYAAHKYSFSALVDASGSSHNIGLSAIMHGDGFRSDGSYVYYQASVDPDLFTKVEKELQQRGTEIQGYQDEFSDEQKQQMEVHLQTLSEILALCKRKGIAVVGFMPPYPPTVYNAFMGTKSFYRVMLTTTPKRVADIFSEYGYSFFNLSSVETFGGDETEFVDVIHGTDGMYSKIMIYLSERTKDLNGYTDIHSLKEMLKNTKGAFLPF